MGYYHHWDDFPLKEVSYLKGKPQSSKLLVRIMSSSRIMVTQINAKKGAFVPLHHHEAEQIIEAHGWYDSWSSPRSDAITDATVT